MSAERAEFIRRSTCATCLSKGRTLFPVPVAMFCYGLAVCEQDRVCWECRHFVAKMAAFKARALQAQAMFADLIVGKLRKVDSLSSLSISTGLQFHIPSAAVSTTEEKTIYNKLVREGNQETHNEGPCDEVIGDEATCVTTCDEVLDKIFDDELSSDEWQEDLTVLNNKPAKSKSRTLRKKEKNKTDVFTEKKMTEEEMWQWRERKKVSEEYLNSIPIYRCETCIVPFDSMANYTHHMKHHAEASGNISCLICGQRCLDELAMAAHKETHYRLLTCRYCGHEWDEVNAMREHGHGVHNVAFSEWQCDICQREYSSRGLLRIHYSSHTRPRCGECGKQVRPKNMARHVRLHSNPDANTLPCEVCGKRYRGGKTGLELHMRTHRTDVDAEAYCVPCAVQFRDMLAFRNHLKNSSKHSAEQDRKYKCDVCGKRFLLKINVKNHISKQHGTKTYRCLICGQVFKTGSARRKHVRFTHEGAKEVKDQVCDYCGKAFATKTVLMEHVNSHTGARPHACNLCGATFGYKSALYLHGRYKHKLNKKTDTTQADRRASAEKNP